MKQQIHNQPIRLQKLISATGYCSRREAEKLILAKKVYVNNRLVNQLGTKAYETDKIVVNNKLLTKAQKYYFIFHKPVNVVCTNKTHKLQKKVIDYFKSFHTLLFTVGRLDYKSSGLIFVTNDGQWAQKISHPSYQCQKIYLVCAKGILSFKQINVLKQGVYIDNHYLTKKCAISNISYDKGKQTTNFNICLTEGHNRQIRKMIEAINSKVINLKRVQIGKIKLPYNLAPGHFRPLTEKEKQFF